MSIQGNAGAMAVSGEILSFIEVMKLKYSDRPEIIAVLEEVEKEARRIRDEADAGWY